MEDEPQNKICIEYVRDVPGVCGRLFTEKMMECLVSKETIERLKREERKNYLHILDVCEKKKCDLNASGWFLRFASLLEIGEIDVDLSDYIEFDGDQDMSFLQVKIDAFSSRCAPLVARFRAALQEMCEAIRGFHDSTPLVKVLPSGGAMRTRCLQQELKRAVQSLGWNQADLMHTLNMDEPVALGAAVMDGARAFDCIVAVRGGDRGEIMPPCGNCRQILGDYMPDCWVIVEDEGGLCKVRAKELLPFPYHAEY